MWAQKVLYDVPRKSMPALLQLVSWQNVSRASDVWPFIPFHMFVLKALFRGELIFIYTRCRNTAEPVARALSKSTERPGVLAALCPLPGLWVPSQGTNLGPFPLPRSQNNHLVSRCHLTNTKCNPQPWRRAGEQLSSTWLPALRNDLRLQSFATTTQNLWGRTWGQ